MCICAKLHMKLAAYLFLVVSQPCKYEMQKALPVFFGNRSRIA